MSVEKDLATQVTEKLQSAETVIAAPGKFRKAAIIFGVILVVGLIAAAWYGWQRHTESEAKLQRALTLNQEQAQNVNVLQNELKLSKQNAEMLASAVKQAQDAKIQPILHFNVLAPTVESAAKDVADRINAKDPELPPDALGKSDRTLTVPQQVKQPDGSLEWQVGVYKVNNYRNWEWTAGYGQHGGDRYIPIELQRNFSKDAAVSYEHHFGGNDKGWEVKYTRMTNKLFILF